MFNSAEPMFSTAELKFNTVEHTFNDAEHNLSVGKDTTLYRKKQDFSRI